MSFRDSCLNFGRRDYKLYSIHGNLFRFVWSYSQQISFNRMTWMWPVINQLFAGLFCLHESELSSLFNGRELYSNNITGKVPEELGNLTNLVSLDLYLNHLSGTIPNSLGNLQKLRFLYDILSLFSNLWSAKFIYAGFNFFLPLPCSTSVFLAFPMQNVVDFVASTTRSFYFQQSFNIQKSMPKKV